MRTQRAAVVAEHVGERDRQNGQDRSERQLHHERVDEERARLRLVPGDRLHQVGRRAERGEEREVADEGGGELERAVVGGGKMAREDDDDDRATADHVAICDAVSQTRLRWMLGLMTARAASCGRQRALATRAPPFVPTE